MRVSYSKSKNHTNYYIINDYTKNGKRSTKIVDKIGNDKKISELAKKENIDVKTWLNNYLENYISENSKKKEIVIIEKNTNKVIPKNQTRLYNIGYLFLKKLYYDLRLNDICTTIENNYSFKFDLNDILSYLIFGRIIYPNSKSKTHKLCKNFIECPNIKLENFYRGLTYLNKESDYIQKEVYKNSKSVVDRNSKILYYDCTNYYFEIFLENDFQKRGISKEHKTTPIVGMGLFMDGDGLPISFNIFPGNKAEVETINDEENKIINEFNLSTKKIVLCTDAGFAADKVKNNNVTNRLITNDEIEKAFVITQSIKKTKENIQEEIFDSNNWRLVGNLKTIYNLDDIINNEKKYYNKIFYKIIQTETKSVKQDLIVTYSLKYRDYKRKVRNNQIELAKKKIENQSKNNKKKKTKKSPNDYNRFIKENSTTSDGEIAEEYYYELDNDAIKNEEKYDGYYAVTTNLDDDIEDILKIVKGRWEIEESFRIMKSDFKARPVHLQKEDRIKAHFLTCYLSLLIFRILEKKLDYKYTVDELLDTIRNMMVLEQKGNGYEPAYERTDLTDNLHEKFKFRTDYEINTYKDLENIYKYIKK